MNRSSVFAVMVATGFVVLLNALFFADGLATSALAQAKVAAPVAAPSGVIIESSETIEVEGTAPQAAPATNVPPAANSAGAGPELDDQQKQQRQQKIQQLNFDRRPSAILKAWVEVNTPKVDPLADAVRAPKPVDNRPVPAPRPVSAAAAKTQKDAALTKEFDERLKKLQQAVTLGKWKEAKTHLDQFTKDETKAIFDRLLESLKGSPGRGQQQIDPSVLAKLIEESADIATMQRMLSEGGQGPGAAFLERHAIGSADMVGIISLGPAEFEKDVFTKLGGILRQMISDGQDLEKLIEEMVSAKRDGNKELLTRRQLAKLLFACGQELRAGEFLPKLDEAQAARDGEALNLLSRYSIALHGKEKKSEILEQAWSATQAVLSSPDVKPEAKEEALKRAVELAPRIRKELGQKWLDDSFTRELPRGREILATIGSYVSTSLQSRPYSPEQRLGALKLQKTAVDALLTASPDTAVQWNDALTLLAANWMKEADVTYRLEDGDHSGGRWRHDRYGNYYLVDEESDQTNVRRYQNGSIQAIGTDDLLENRPGDKWLAHVDNGLKPEYAALMARLYLKASEETQSFPYIEQLAKTHPELAKGLVQDFLRVWTSNHNPNESRDQNQSYFYYWGYEARAERIPLTRSKQDRNVAELAAVIKKLRAMNVGKIDEQLLTKAFTTCHSKAEVYKLEAFENVFGSLEALEPRTLAELIQQMRGNLVSVWRAPDVQKQNSTNRKQKDIQAEVMRGYQVAQSVVQKGLEKYPGHWALLLAEAAVMHDENEYRQELAKSSEFSARRNDALAKFEAAAKRYGESVPKLPENEETTLVYEQWFYTSLGAVDLARVTDDKVPDLKQPARIREAILALPAEASKRHMAKFANNLFTRLSSKSELKYRYLRAGFEIVGDHKLSQEARKVLDYYQDLANEIKLVATIDGSDAVGHDKPFGVFVDIRHTKEIERESGGFGRYLQNQNNMYNSYNYGRPNENYRDKFSESATKALEEHFKVLSVTFQVPDVNSKAPPEYGWRVTPYAYILLKAKGPEVDKLPPLKLNLDFLDTSGYAVIPIETAALPLDARTNKPAARPAEEVRITQILDERQAKEGKLLLEVKATSRGLVPEFDDLLTVKPEVFELVKTNDDGVSVVDFNKEADATCINSQRTWTLTLNAKKDLPELPKSFEFATAKVPTKEMVYQRYDDADLVNAEKTISLEERYGSVRRTWMWAWLGGLAAVGLFAVGIWSWRRNRRPAPEPPFRLPERLTPFTVLGLLREIEHNNGFEDARKHELAATIRGLETHYFDQTVTSTPDLTNIAQSWIDRAGNGRNGHHK